MQLVPSDQHIRRNARAMSHTAPSHRLAFTHDNPRVQVFPSPNGTVHIVGVSHAGSWVAEHICRIEAYGPHYVEEMEREVKAFEASETDPHPHLVASPQALEWSPRHPARP